MMQKSQETMLVYKKYSINPISGCLFAVIQIPLFFAFYESLNRLQLFLKELF
jgi:YidC/Oxa1 family membrane protein insertase